jgi:aspartate aminotransferase-like enzyme
VPLVLAVEESLRLIEKEGLDSALDRHARQAEACRAAVQAWGLSLFSERPANGLTAVRSPEEKDAEEVVRHLREEHRMRIAGGQEPMKGRLFRLGHMGWQRDEDILDLLAATEATLHHLKWTGAAGAREAAEAILDRSALDGASGPSG